MNTPRAVISSSLATNLARAAGRTTFSSTCTTTGLRCGYSVLRPHKPNSNRQFSTTKRSQLEFFAPPKNAPNIKLTPPAWPHPDVEEKDLLKIEGIVHREPETISDRVAFGLVKMLRWGTDLATGYRADKSTMNERKWLVRFVFLETVAGVPGMVAGMLRHFHSLRRMKRDNGWIETMLEDAYNERMHLLTFLKMAQPGWFMKLMILGAQGVFSNAFFLAYLFSPKTAHRFVGYLEEEATHTYTVAIQDLDAGRLPGWEHLQAPEIAVRYWNMPEGKRTMRDLLLQVRADEAKHREIHHTMANLNQTEDPNPFVSEYKDPNTPHPSRGIEHIKSKGWERKDVIGLP